MNLTVAVGAAPVEETALRCQIITSVTRVTLVAEPRHPHFKQAVVDRTVGLMAMGAILKNRRMLVQVGPPSLGMAAIAVLVNARLLELRGIRGAMWVVAVRTGHLSFPHRHVGRA